MLNLLEFTKDFTEVFTVGWGHLSMNNYALSSGRTVRTKVKMTFLIGSGRFGQAVMIAVRSGSVSARCAKFSAKSF